MNNAPEHLASTAAFSASHYQEKACLSLKRVDRGGRVLPGAGPPLMRMTVDRAVTLLDLKKSLSLRALQRLSVPPSKEGGLLICSGHAGRARLSFEFRRSVDKVVSVDLRVVAVGSPNQNCFSFRVKLNEHDAGQLSPSLE